MPSQRGVSRLTMSVARYGASLRAHPLPAEVPTFESVMERMQEAGRVAEPPITETVGTQLAAGCGPCSSLARAEPVLCEANLRGEFTGSSGQGVVG